MKRNKVWIVRVISTRPPFLGNRKRFSTIKSTTRMFGASLYNTHIPHPTYIQTLIQYKIDSLGILFKLHCLSLCFTTILFRLFYFTSAAISICEMNAKWIVNRPFDTCIIYTLWSLFEEIHTKKWFLIFTQKPLCGKSF